ncbi:MAG TPA: TlpA disulfide reductase family protein [Chitinophagaceae bacterium]|nr:TlpA disulfide reductase family protein [Chitinophagaceae bacterium]
MEGKEIKNVLLGRIVATHNNVEAPDFETMDIYGHQLALSNERGKYVLINLWATWCGPCIAELPAIRRIRKQYPRSQLKIISVSCDRDSSAFAKAIKKYKMTWTQIYNDKNLIIKFGGVTSLPQLFLINEQGQIIYNRNVSKNGASANLNHLNALLQNSLKHS